LKLLTKWRIRRNATTRPPKTTNATILVDPLEDESQHQGAYHEYHDRLGRDVLEERFDETHFEVELLFSLKMY
jgi:hypothetical protein